MSAESEMRNAILHLERMTHEVFVGVVTEAQRSIVEGSEITAAPGQPVDTGALKASWQAVFDSPTQATIGTNIEYAPYIEEGVGRGPLTKRSEVGGFHSVQLTVAGMPAIVDVVTSNVAGGLQRFDNGAGGWSGEDGG